MSLDAVDRKILNMLLQSGRVSYTDIAKAVNMKPPSVIDRIKKMENDGIIRDYTTNIDYQKLGYDIMAFIGILVDNSDHVSTVDRFMRDYDNAIISCYHVSGDFSLIVRLITENTSTLAQVIKKIRAIPGVTKTNTILIFSTLMDRPRTVD